MKAGTVVLFTFLPIVFAGRLVDAVERSTQQELEEIERSTQQELEEIELEQLAARTVERIVELYSDELSDELYSDSDEPETGYQLALLLLAVDQRLQQIRFGLRSGLGLDLRHLDLRQFRLNLGVGRRIGFERGVGPHGVGPRALERRRRLELARHLDLEHQLVRRELIDRYLDLRRRHGFRRRHGLDEQLDLEHEQLQHEHQLVGHIIDRYLIVGFGRLRRHVDHVVDELGRPERQRRRQLELGQLVEQQRLRRLRPGRLRQLRRQFRPGQLQRRAGELERLQQRRQLQRRRRLRLERRLEQLEQQQQQPADFEQLEQQQLEQQQQQQPAEPADYRGAKIQTAIIAGLSALMIFSVLASLAIWTSKLGKKSSQKSIKC